MIRQSRISGRKLESQRNMPEIAIAAENLEKKFAMEKNNIEVLRGLQFEFQSGEIVALMGPSGAGKTTLLHLIGLMEKPTSGELNILGWKVSELSDAECDMLRNKYIGMMFQFHYLIPELTVLENALLPLKIMGETVESKDVTEELLVAVGLKERMTHYPSELSGGEQQRVALARAMVTRPAILICDEPTGNLDLERGEQVRDLIWRVARSHHTTVVVATHNPDIAQTADRIVKIADGTIRENIQLRTKPIAERSL